MDNAQQVHDESKAIDWNKGGNVKAVKTFHVGMEVQFNRSVWDRMQGWCQAATSEVSGMGLVRKKGNILQVYDVFLPKQECSAGFTEIKPEATADMMRKIHKRGIPQDHLRFWWHTHYNFNVFWSATDVATARKLAGTSADWMLSLVINQKREYKCRIDLMKPFHVAMDDFDEVYIMGNKPKRKVRYKRDIKRQVEPYTFVTQYYHHNNPQVRHPGGRPTWSNKKEIGHEFGGFSQHTSFNGPGKDRYVLVGNTVMTWEKYLQWKYRNNPDPKQLGFGDGFGADVKRGKRGCRR